MWGAEGGLGDAGGFQAVLGCREVLLPSSLAHPTIFLLLLLLSPVLNSVAMATMSTTFQLPRDGLRRGGGEEGSQGKGGTGGIARSSGGPFPDGFFLLDPVWRVGPVPAQRVPRGQGVLA